MALDLCALGEKQEFCVEVGSNGKRLWLDFKTDSAKDFWVKVEKIKLLESFEEDLEELTAKLLCSYMKVLNKPPCISNDNKS